MRKNRVIEQNRCYHLVSRLAHRAFFLDDGEKDRAVALMRRVEAGAKASMSYCINRTVSISSDPFASFCLKQYCAMKRTFEFNFYNLLSAVQYDDVYGKMGIVATYLDALQDADNNSGC